MPTLSSELPAAAIETTPSASSCGNPIILRLESLAPLTDVEKALLKTSTEDVRVLEARADLTSLGFDNGGAIAFIEGLGYRYKVRANGERQITDYLLPGEICFLDKISSNDRVGAFAKSKVARLSSQKVAEYKNNIVVAQALEKLQTVNEAILREWLINVGRRSAEERIAHLFCEIHLRLEAVDLVSNNSFFFPLTQFDVGDTMGLSYVHVNRTIQSIRQSNLIALKGRKLTILELGRLRQLAEFDPSYLCSGRRA